MTKLLLILLAIVVAYWIIKSYRRKSADRGGASPRSEDMVRCAQCGVHLPRSEGLLTGQTFYCSAEHRRLHEQKADS